MNYQNKIKDLIRASIRQRYKDEVSSEEHIDVIANEVFASMGEAKLEKMGYDYKILVEEIGFGIEDVANSFLKNFKELSDRLPPFKTNK